MSKEYDIFIEKLHQLIKRVNENKQPAPGIIISILDKLSQRRSSSQKLMQSSYHTHYEYEVVRRAQAHGFCRKIHSVNCLIKAIPHDAFHRISEEIEFEKLN